MCSENVWECIDSIFHRLPWFHFSSSSVISVGVALRTNFDRTWFVMWSCTARRRIGANAQGQDERTHQVGHNLSRCGVCCGPRLRQPSFSSTWTRSNDSRRKIAFSNINTYTYTHTHSQNSHVSAWLPYFYFRRNLQDVVAGMFFEIERFSWECDDCAEVPLHTRTSWDNCCGATVWFLSAARRFELFARSKSSWHDCSRPWCREILYKRYASQE